MSNRSKNVLIGVMAIVIFILIIALVGKDNTKTSVRNINPGQEYHVGDSKFILNTNTHKFHRPSCSSVGQMNEWNKKVYYGTRSEVIDMGYSPCQRCYP